MARISKPSTTRSSEVGSTRGDSLTSLTRTPNRLVDETTPSLTHQETQKSPGPCTSDGVHFRSPSELTLIPDGPLESP